jgi:hypothetical protein
MVRSFLVALLAGALLTACGGGGGSSGSVSPDSWASTVCSQIVSWQQQIQTLGSGMESRIQASGGDLQAARTQLVDFLGDVVNRTDQMIQRIGDAGTPKTDKGDQIASDVKNGLQDVKQVFQDGKQRAENLSVSDPSAFQQGAEQVGNQLQQAGDTIQQRFNALDQKYNSADLNKAFKETPECKQLSSS